MAEQKPALAAKALPEADAARREDERAQPRPDERGAADKPKKAIAKRKAQPPTLSSGCRKRLRERLETAIGLSLEAMKDFHRSANPEELNLVLEGQLGVYMHHFKDGGAKCMRRVREALEAAMDSTLEAMTHLHGMEAPKTLNGVFVRQTELYAKHFG